MVLYTAYSYAEFGLNHKSLLNKPLLLLRIDYVNNKKEAVL
jgi:hypothetical protein